MAFVFLDVMQSSSDTKSVTLDGHPQSSGGSYLELIDGLTKLAAMECVTE